MFHKKIVTIRISTFDADLEFPVKENIKGKDLFELVSRTIGLRETWFFGLLYKGGENGNLWIRRDKKVLKQIGKELEVPRLHLQVQFYPEDVENELVQDITQHLFFLQIQNSILNMDVYCPAEASVLLASYALQAKYGDYDRGVHKPGFLSNEVLLPKGVFEQYQLTPEMWEEKIVHWYARHCGLHRSDAKMEYLKIAQDLNMYGINYYKIQNRNHTDLWLGIHATGINIYEYNSRLTPKVSFSWSETRHIAFRNKKFYIQSINKDSADFIFFSLNGKINREILDFCIGNHDLYMKRRKPDTIEIQQMKIQAKEEKSRREEERKRFVREKEEREHIAIECEELRKRIQNYQQELEKSRQLLIKSEETTELLAEKAKVVEEESDLLVRKARDLEDEVKLLKSTILRREEERVSLENKIKDSELTIQTILQESHTKSKEAGLLRQELQTARLQEKHAKERLIEITAMQHMMPLVEQRRKNDEVSGSADLLTEDSVALLSKTIQKERVEYLQKSQNLHKQLSDLRSEIEGLKTEGPTNRVDGIPIGTGNELGSEHSASRRMPSETMDTRVQFYERL